jgi:zinc protease
MSLELKPLHFPARAAALANGLRVIAHEERASPIVAVHLMYDAGSKHEAPGRTGLAHLLEHLLFEGSENCPKGEFDRLLERVGGTNNGSTWMDRTNYYEVVPTHAVELALWLERERMGHFLPVLDAEMLEVQRSVVINERKQVYENRPYGLAHERLHELLFPTGHPYSWPTIGYTADLEAITLEDARAFYRNFYAPDNAVLVLSGDIAADQAFELAQKYFGDLSPAGARPRLPESGGRRFGGETAVLEDRVTFPRVYHAYAVPPYGSLDWVALDVLTYLLAEGESSRFQRSLIRERELAQEVDTYLYPTQLSGIFGIVATARAGVTPDQLIAALDGVLETVRGEGVSSREVDGAVRRARRDHLNGLANVEERAEELAYAATVLGAAGRLEEILNQYSEVGPEDVRRVAERSLDPATRATVVVVPRTVDR